MRNLAKKGSTYFADEYARSSVKGIADHEMPLTALGHRQALITGQELRRRFPPFDYAYHSGYRRTVDTLDALLRPLSAVELKGVNVRMNPFIRERDPGHTYDMTTAEAEAAFPYLKGYWHTFGGFFAQPPGGESLAQVSERVYLFLNMLFRDRQGERVLVVTHGGTLRCFRFLLERWDYERATSWPQGQAPANCGVTVYVYDHESSRLKLVKYNEVY